jgi:hypothetical protein
MKRREFMVGLGALAASTAAHGQQEALPVIGFVNSASPGPFAHLAAGFRKGLAEEGFEEHRDVSVEWRWAEGRYDRIPLLPIPEPRESSRNEPSRCKSSSPPPLLTTSSCAASTWGVGTLAVLNRSLERRA